MTASLLQTTPAPLSAQGRFWALVPCAGTGSRALSEPLSAGLPAPLPKQYQPVAGVPMVLHTLAAFAGVGRLLGTLVAVAPGDRFLDAHAHPAWFCVECGGATRADTVLGSGGSWTTCAAKVALLALPALGAGLLALRRLAPTGLTAAGALVGGAAGACGAFAYAFTCPESSPAYVAIWYSAGIAACAGLGALAGPRLLRW